MLLIVSLFNLSGCAALKKKFTRKPKDRDEKKIEDVVLIPEEYPVSDVDPEVKYKEHYILWKSWQDELIMSLNPDGSKKRQLFCFNGVIFNLEKMQSLLNTKKRQELQEYIDTIKIVMDRVEYDRLSSVNIVRYQDKMNRVRRKIKLEFSYRDISEFITGTKDDI